jgi:hypothetical protein
MQNQENGLSAVPAMDKEKSMHLEELVDAGDPQADTKRQYIQRGLTLEEADFLLSLSEKEKDHIYRKVDFRLVPMLALLYLVRWPRLGPYIITYTPPDFPPGPSEHRQRQNRRTRARPRHVGYRLQHCRFHLLCSKHFTRDS